MGEYLARIRPRLLALHIVPVLALCIAALFLAPQAERLADVEVPLALYQAYVPWLIAAALAATLGAAAALVMALKSHPLASVITLSLAGLMSAQLVLTGHDHLSPASSTYHLIERIKPQLRPDAPFYSISIYDQTLPFYIQRNVTLVEYTGELSFGIDQEPGSFMRTYGEFEQRWAADTFAMAIMHPGTLAYFDRHKVPYVIIARDTRRVIVRKP